MIPLDTREVELAHLRLNSNPYIEKYLKRWVEPGFESPLLGQNLLLDLLSDDHPDGENIPSEEFIAELERNLRDGEKHCINFGDIFKGNPSENHGVSNGQIVDKLAEVEAFRWLRKQGFIQLSKLVESGQSTVDFIGERKGCRWGIEVTRLGVPYSSRKTSEPYFKNHSSKAFDSSIVPKMENSIWDAINKKRTQLKSWKERNPVCNLLVAVSTGHCFGLNGRFLRPDGGFLDDTWGGALETAWVALNDDNYGLVDSVVLLNGSSEHVFPPLE